MILHLEGGGWPSVRNSENWGGDYQGNVISHFLPLITGFGEENKKLKEKTNQRFRGFYNENYSPGSFGKLRNVTLRLIKFQYPPRGEGGISNQQST